MPEQQAIKLHAEEITSTLTREEYLHLARILQLLGAGIQLYLQGWQPDPDIIKSISAKMFDAFMKAEDEVLGIGQSENKETVNEPDNN